MLLASAASGPAFAAPPTPEPYMLVRSLRMLQDQVASGKPEALPMLNRVLGRIAIAFRTASPEVWSKPANAYASMVYLLNGGNPDVVRDILTSENLAPLNASLIDGALAYADGNGMGLLENYSDKLPPETPGELVASIYLVTAAQLASVDTTSAMARLDQVRLAVPGTLLEEAALRRSLIIAAKIGDGPKLLATARNYLQRFSFSPYSEDFFRQLVDAIILIGDKVSNDEIDELLRYARNRSRLPFFLRVARGAVVDGQIKRAQYAATEAEKLAEKLKLDTTQAKLYRTISEVGSKNTQDALTALSAFPKNRLHERDLQLLEAAQGIAGQIVRPPEAKKPQNPAQAPTPEDDGSDEPVEVVEDEEQVNIAPALDPDLIPPAMAVPEAAGDRVIERADKALIDATKQKLSEIDALLGEAR
ncbi:MAG: chemotaxis protein [Phyllobacterium sp.]